MAKMSRLYFVALPAISLALSACTQPASSDPDPGGGTGGRGNGTGGRTNPPATGGAPMTGNGGSVTPPAQGGSPGAGGVPGTGGGAVDPDAGPPPGSGGMSGTGGTVPPPDGGNPPPVGACNYTPKENALSKNLKFDRITLMGLPGGDNNRPYNGGITELKFIPGTQDELFITRKGGGLHHYKIAGNTAMLVSNTTVPGVSGREDCGLIGLAVDPDFATNKFLYVGHCVGAAGRQSKFMRYTYNNGMLTDGVEILGIDGGAGNNSWHSVGSMGFDNDKNLWMLHGEFVRGAPAQDLNSNLGKLLRVQPSRMAGMGGFKPATGNPAPNAIYARGLRSPWRGAYHPGKNWYIIGDVGPDPSGWEEINIVTEPGANLGWPNGTCNAGSIACWTTQLRVQKVMDADNLSETNAGRAGRSAWAAAPYGDCGKDQYGGAMTGVALAGDFFKGWVLGITFNDQGGKARDKNLATFTMISGVDQGPDGYLYALKFGKYHQGADGENVANQGLYRIVAE